MHMAKEAYADGKRDLCTWQKRPMQMAKETYAHGKRDLFKWQKRPMHMAKEVCIADSIAPSSHSLDYVFLGEASKKIMRGGERVQ